MTKSAATAAALAELDSRGLPFVAEMYGVQFDQLADWLDLSGRQVGALVSRWSARGLADTAVLSAGPPWVWLTRSGLQACGVRYPPAAPALPRLAHIRATTAVRLAVAETPAYADGNAFWRSERHLRSRVGGRLGLREHLPDAELHWPDGGPLPWAGECWAIEVELTAKTVSRTALIMREILGRTGDYGCLAAEARVAGRPSRHTRVLYVCAAPAIGTVRRAAADLGSLAARIEICALPAAASLPPATAPASAAAGWSRGRPAGAAWMSSGGAGGAGGAGR